LGVPEDDPEFRWALQQLDDLMIPEDDTLRLQPCVSPVWDTALTLIGLADAGIPPRAEAVRAGVDWLVAKEVRRPGDWSLANACRSPTTTPCSTQAARTSPPASSKRSATTATAPTTRRSSGPSPSSAAPRSRTAAGRGGGALTTSTAPGRCSRGWPRSACRPT